MVLSCRGDTITGAMLGIRGCRVMSRTVPSFGIVGITLATDGAEETDGELKAIFGGSRRKMIIAAIKPITAMATAGPQMKAERVRVLGRISDAFLATASGGVGNSAARLSLTTSATTDRQLSQFARWASTRVLPTSRRAPSTYAAMVSSPGHVHRRLTGLFVRS